MPKVKFESSFKKKSNRLIPDVFSNPNNLLNPLIVSCLFHPSPVHRRAITSLNLPTKSSIPIRTTSFSYFAYYIINDKWFVTFFRPRRLKIRGKSDTSTDVGIELSKSKSPIVFFISSQSFLKKGYSICKIAS
jgi:hypothetical protein